MIIILNNKNKGIADLWLVKVYRQHYYVMNEQLPIIIINILIIVPKSEYSTKHKL